MTRLLTAIWVVLSILAFSAFLFYSDPLRNAVLRLRPIGLAMLVLAAATGIGWLATRWFRRDFLLYVATGIGLLALTVLLLGAAAHLEPIFLTIIIVTGAVLFAAAIAVERPWRAIERGCGPWSVVGWVGLGAAVVIIVPFLVAPELSTDSLQYHLLVPRLYLDQGAIRYIPLLVGSNYPSLAEYVYLVILAIGDDVGTKSFHFLMALVVLLTIRRLVRQLVPDSDGVLAAALFFVTPVALITAAWSLNDMVFTFFLLLSASELLERRLVTAGLLFGLATWTKYTFVLFLIPFAAMLLLGVSASSGERGIWPASRSRRWPWRRSGCSRTAS